jgi:hypothetical protein
MDRDVKPRSPLNPAMEVALTKALNQPKQPCKHKWIEKHQQIRCIRCGKYSHEQG